MSGFRWESRAGQAPVDFGPFWPQAPRRLSWFDRVEQFIDQLTAVNSKAEDREGTDSEKNSSTPPARASILASGGAS